MGVAAIFLRRSRFDHVMHISIATATSTLVSITDTRPANRSCCLAALSGVFRKTIMPVSTVSVDSTKSTSSAGSRKFRRQRIVSKTSQVDEMLFGPPARLQQMTGNRSWDGTLCSSAAPKKTGRRISNDPEVMEVITKDLIRKIRVPASRDPSGLTVVMGKSEFERIKQNAKVLTTDDRKLAEMTAKSEKNARLEASNTRKRAMQELEIERKKNEKPSDLEQEAHEKGADLVAKARGQMEEQDDEIKKLNEVILNAKCHAIRDAQLKEKDDIRRAMEDEEVRLDTMMEIDRLKALQEYEKREQERQTQRLRGAEVIQHQIDDREQHRLLDAERKDQETQSMLRYLERLQQEDMDNLTKKRQAQQQLMDEVAKCNEEIQRQKMLQREQEKLEDIRVMEYMKEKERREEEHQKELEEQKIEKEREIARLRAQQERAKDKQAERDALRAKRRQEEFEREWRRKEKEEATKKTETEQMLIGARMDQVRNKEHFLAVQAQRDRAEFERVLMVQQELMETDKKKQQDGAAKRAAHAEEVRRQVRKKEDERIAARRGFFEEGIKLDQEARERRAKLDGIKQRKLAELKAAGIPDKYCAEVSRRIIAPPPSFAMS